MTAIMLETKHTRVMKKSASNTKNSGRKPVQINVEHYRDLAGLGCTTEEIAAFFKVSKRTILRLKDDPVYADAMEQGIMTRRRSLRRWQYEAAKKGNVTMLIWLGKTELGQKETTNLEHSGEIKGAPLWPLPDTPLDKL